MDLQLLTGLQHVGIPTNDIKKTLLFYEKIGFKVVFQTVLENQAVPILFLKLKNLMIELYESNAGEEKAGSIDHIAIGVTNIEKVFEQVRAEGFKIVNDSIQFLPFFGNGVKFFTVEGPNTERIEFNQIL